jgi:hypothetical protein
MPVKLDATYPVSDGDVALTVIVGNKQLGTSRARIGAKALHTGDFKNFILGKGRALKGKVLSLKTVVADVNDKTNLTSVRYVIDGGANPATWDLEATVAQNGDSIIYRVNVEFV